MSTDIRTEKLHPVTMKVEITLHLLAEQEQNDSLLRNVEEELALMIGKRVEETPWITHVTTETFSVMLEGGWNA